MRIASIRLPLTLFHLFSCNQRSGKPRVLVFSKTTGFRHGSIPAGKDCPYETGRRKWF